MGIKDRLSSAVPSRRFNESSFVMATMHALNAALKSSGMQRKDLADKLGISKGRVSQYLNGGENVTLRTLAAISWAMGKRCRIVIEDDVKDVSGAGQLNFVYRCTDEPAVVKFEDFEHGQFVPAAVA